MGFPLHVLLFICAGSTLLTALEPVDRLRLDREGRLTAPVYQGETMDGRVILVLSESAEPDSQPDAPLLMRIQRWTAAGALVVVVEIEPQTRPTTPNDHRYERLWRGLVNNLSERLPKGIARRLIFVPQGHELAEPVPFHTHGGRQLMLDLVYPLQPTQPSPALIRIESGAFGADIAFYLADNGFAMAQIPDPFYDLKMDGEQAIAYGRAAAAAIRAQATAAQLNGRIGILGKSKHGFASALIGAGATHAESDPRGDIQAVIAMTDTLDPATRHEDWSAAGHRSDGNPDNSSDPHGSPVQLLRPGGPAFFLCHAHGRTSRQSERMIAVLERHQVPYQQSWYPDRLHFARRSADAIRVFLETHLTPP